MKKLLALIALATLACSMVAADFPLAQMANTLSYTNTASITGTNTASVVQTNYAELNNYHTFQIVSSSTNTATVTLDRSVNGSNWVPWSTNTFSAAGTVDQTLTGKWAYFRYTVAGSNVTATIYYLGGK